jgi:hypothetical protein
LPRQIKSTCGKKWGNLGFLYSFVIMGFEILIMTALFGSDVKYSYYQNQVSSMGVKKKAN